jgi:serine/threonine-protein kinase
MDAFVSAIEAHHDTLVASSANLRAFVVGQWLRQYEEAHRWSRIALGAVRRLGGDVDLEAELLRNEIMLAVQRNDRAAATDATARALRFLQQRKPNELQRSTILLVLGGAFQLQNKYAEAEAHLKEGLAIREKVNGPEHPSLAAPLNSLGAIAFYQEHYAEAADYYRRALALWQAALPADSPQEAIGLSNLGEALMHAGKHAESLELYRRSLAMSERRFGVDYVENIYQLLGIGENLRALARPGEALVPLERGLKLGLANASDVDVPTLTELRFSLARTLWAVGRDRPRSRTLAARALDDARKAANEPLARKLEDWLAHPG